MSMLTPRRYLRYLLLCLGFVFAAALGAAAPAPTPPRPAAAPAWWQHAVIYEIYPRSFADSDNDGTGDLRGITAHLGYLQSLGVNAIWITPFYPSPQVDFGYDISNYDAIDPRYGTLADFDALLAAAHRRHIRVLLDLVLNHTSDQHPWFLNSRSSRTAKYRDFYIWRDGRNGGPPNNWTSIFGGSAWEYDPRTGQYYYHFFYKQQPDLNWRNPAVEKAMFDNVRFWLRRGVDGFRLDAVTTLFEDPRLRDNPMGVLKTGDFLGPQQIHKYNQNLPEVHGVLRRLRRLADQYHAVLIGETVGDNEAELSQYYGAHNDEIELPFDFLFADVNRLSAPEFRRRIAAWDGNAAHGTPDWFFDNHDQPRELDRYGDKIHNRQIARLLPTLLLTLRGTAILYYGQEIGMVTTDPVSLADVRDPVGRRWWPRFKGRDGERTPMQWNGGVNGGFCRVRPWLPVPASAKTVNVAAEERDPHSLLAYYRALLHLRSTDAALRAGRWRAIDVRDPDVLAYLRQTNGESVLVALNMSARPQRRDLTAAGAARARLLLDSRPRAPELALARLALQPYEALVARLQPAAR